MWQTRFNDVLDMIDETDTHLNSQLQASCDKFLYLKTKGITKLATVKL